GTHRRFRRTRWLRPPSRPRRHRHDARVHRSRIAPGLRPRRPDLGDPEAPESSPTSGCSHRLHHRRLPRERQTHRSGLHRQGASAPYTAGRNPMGRDRPPHIPRRDGASPQQALRIWLLRHGPLQPPHSRRHRHPHHQRRIHLRLRPRHGRRRPPVRLPPRSPARGRRRPERAGPQSDPVRHRRQIRRRSPCSGGARSPGEGRRGARSL
ncbi:N-carbamoylsarcosine amidase, partial [uncultured Rubrobacteraceae bacterium]